MLIIQDVKRETSQLKLEILTFRQKKTCEMHYLVFKWVLGQKNMDINKQFKKDKIQSIKVQCKNIKHIHEATGLKSQLQKTDKD